MGTDYGEQQQLLRDDGAADRLRRRNQFNVMQLGAIFCMLFTAFSVVQNLETKLNGNLGLISLSTLYGCFTLGGFVAGFVVQKLGERVTLFIGATAYVAYVAANIEPEIYWLLPASAYLGFGAAILWAAQGSYVAKCSTKETLGANSGLFFAFFMMNNVIGNLAAGGLLLSGRNMHFLFWVLLSIGGCANLLFLTLRKPSELVVTDTTSVVEKKAASLSEIFMLFREPKMLLMIPALLYSGFSQSFFLSRLPQQMPIEGGWIGWIMAFFGLADTLGSVIFGRLSDRVGKKPVLIIASLCTIGGCVMAGAYLDPQRAGYTTSAIWPFFIIMGLLGLRYRLSFDVTLGYFVVRLASHFPFAIDTMAAFDLSVSLPPTSGVCPFILNT
eukprot:TRINITY_DN6411_c0_g1_i11.p1 TRINITY_DN6411_c0_g1~~TRINITY_DN6411_c0_g1_i11.p1  ORF type:complete len:385 (+),score=121.04 TRINITY_DN6411_c0_g1_i11:141-1295(+)